MNYSDFKSVVREYGSNTYYRNGQKEPFAQTWGPSLSDQEKQKLDLIVEEYEKSLIKELESNS